MPTGFTVHQTVVLHPLFANLQDSPENEINDLNWRQILYNLLCSDLCAQYVLCNTAS